MNEIKRIGSLQNPLIKKVLLLKEKSRERKKLGLFVIEGVQELQLALKGNYDVETLFVYPDFISENRVFEFFENTDAKPQVIEVSRGAFKKMAYRETTEGIIAIAKNKPHSLKDLCLQQDNPLILVAESPEKPGNIGALLRTADAANLDAVIIANPKSDLYNPNIIRSSVGCVFTTRICMANTVEIIQFLKENNISIYCAALSASEKYTSLDFSKASAIVVGTESSGLTSDWLESSDQNIIIPMQGEIDSLNVSVSSAILIFEAIRQRALQ